MKRWMLFAALLISTPKLTDALVDYQFRHRADHKPHENVGYSKADRDGLDRLIERSTAKPKETSGVKAINVQSRYQLEIPFGCDDKGCLTAWAERPHARKGKNQ